uniref:Uncharacterized protein n=1 Tax=Anguilla anguilla TaxID=7936 RepID=A0A0E9VND2_ANGAN
MWVKKYTPILNTVVKEIATFSCEIFRL